MSLLDCLLSSDSDEPVVYYAGTIYIVVIVKTAELYYAGPNVIKTRIKLFHANINLGAILKSMRSSQLPPNHPMSSRSHVVAGPVLN